MTPEMRRELAKPFPPEKVKQKRGQGQRVMSYISHALVTERLNEVDPDWSVENIATHVYRDAQGRLHCEGVEIKLTVGGVSRVEAGGPQRQDGFTNEIKNAYSDALKRAAMRFGVALSMWDSLVDAEFDEDVAAADVAPAPQPAAARTAGSSARSQGRTNESDEVGFVPNEQEADEIAFFERAEAATSDNDWKRLIREAKGQPHRWKALMFAAPNPDILQRLRAAAERMGDFGPEVERSYRTRFDALAGVVR